MGGIARPLQRVVFAAMAVWLASLAVFTMMRIGPGDPVSASLARGDGNLSSQQIEELRAVAGLDRSLVVQYGRWIWGVLKLDPGRSVASGRRVTAELGPRLALTAELAVLAAAMAASAGAGAGLLASWSSGGWLDRTVRVAVLIALSTPAFWLGLIVVIVSAAWFGVLPGAGYATLSESPMDNLLALLPAAAILAVRPAALVARVVRIGTVEAAGQGFVLAARARGATRWRGTWRHAFRVGALPAISVMAVQAVYLLGGAVVIEQVFGLPGVGRAMLDAVAARDYPVIQFLVVISACAAVLMSLAGDALHAFLDPRVFR